MLLWKENRIMSNTIKAVLFNQQRAIFIYINRGVQLKKYILAVWDMRMYQFNSYGMNFTVEVPPINWLDKLMLI